MAAVVERKLVAATPTTPASTVMAPSLPRHSWFQRAVLTAVPFACASSSACIAEAVTLPVDTLKLRMQLQTAPGVGVLPLLRTMVATEGVASLWRGLVRAPVNASNGTQPATPAPSLSAQIPGFQRQFLFGGLRVGLYETVRDGVTALLGKPADGGAAQSTLAVRALSGAISGSLAMLVASPTDLVKVRLQSQSATAAAGGGVPYAGSLDAYARIMREEGGLRALWRGCTPNVARNAAVNMVELMTYDTAKVNIAATFGLSGLPLHVSSAMVCGLAATLAGSPIDVVKSRLMAARGAAAPSGVAAVLASTYAEGGVAGFYRGFAPNFARMAGWNIVFFVSYENFKALLLSSS